MEECPTEIIAEPTAEVTTQQAQQGLLPIEELLTCVRSTLQKEPIWATTPEETTTSLKCLDDITLHIQQTVAERDAAIAATATAEEETQEYVQKGTALNSLLQARETRVQESQITISTLQAALVTSKHALACSRAELRTARGQATEVRNMLATTTEGTIRPGTRPTIPSPEERAKGRLTIKEIITQLKSKADGANKGTKLVSKLFHYITCSYTRIEDIPADTIKAYVENLHRFPSSHLRARSARDDIRAAIIAVAQAPSAPHRFTSVIIDQLRRSQTEMTSLRDNLRQALEGQESAEATSDRIRGHRTKGDLRITTLEKQTLDLQRINDASTSRIRDLRAELRRTTQTNASLTSLLEKRTKLYNEGTPLACYNDTRPSETDLQYLRALSVICASSDIAHWKWVMYTEGYQTTYFEFLSAPAARNILQRSDQSGTPLPTTRTITLTRNEQPLDFLTCSYSADKLSELQDLHAAAMEGDDEWPIIDVGPTPTNKGTPTAVNGVMIGTTLQKLTTTFRTKNRSPFVQVFGTVASFQYVLTATTFIPLRKAIPLGTLQRGYKHRAQGGSYSTTLGLTDTAYTSLQGHFMEWSSTTTKKTGSPHPLLTGPTHAVDNKVKVSIRNKIKLRLESDNKTPKKRKK